MRFSQRTNWNTEESELGRAHRLRKQAGLPIADLTASNPTRCGFDYPASLLDALRDRRALDYDPQPAGTLPARQAVCEYYAGHGAVLDPSQIVLTTSTSEAYSFLFRLLCDPASEILSTKMVTPYSEQWNLSIQRDIPKIAILTVGYVGNEGHHLLGLQETNPGNQALCLSLNDPSPSPDRK